MAWVTATVVLEREEAIAKVSQVNMGKSFTHEHTRVFLCLFICELLDILSGRMVWVTATLLKIVMLT
jgi:hypothetical protein